MKIEYDVPTPKQKHNSYGHGKHSILFWSFYESEHQNVKLEYCDDEECKKAQKAFLNILSRNKIYDVDVNRRGKVIYLERVERNG